MKIFLILLFATAYSQCLTPEQDAQLKEAVTIIGSTLTITTDALKIAAAFESDPQTKQNLLEAVRIIDIVNQELVSNLTAIADETCGTCSQITAAVNDIVNTLEDMMTQIEPDWKDDPLYKSIVEAIQAVLDIVKAVCPSGSAVRSLSAPLDSCLTPEQDAQLKEAADDISKLLKTTVISLRIAAAAEEDPQTKANLKEAADIISVVNQEIVQNLTKIADETCGTCSEITKAVGDIIIELEDTLTRIEPDWENDPVYKAIVEAIQAVLDIVMAVCPSEEFKMQRAPRAANGSCLTPAQDAQLKEAAEAISTVLGTTVVALRIAEAAEKDPQTKANLKLAAQIIQAVNQEIVRNLTKIADETCGTCSEITKAVEDIIDELEDTLTRIEPDWKNNPIYKAVVDAIQAVLDIVEAVCPSDEVFAESYCRKVAMDAKMMWKKATKCCKAKCTSCSGFKRKYMQLQKIYNEKCNNSKR